MVSFQEFCLMQWQYATIPSQKILPKPGKKSVVDIVADTPSIVLIFTKHPIEIKCISIRPWQFLFHSDTLVLTGVLEQELIMKLRRWIGLYSVIKWVVLQNDIRGFNFAESNFSKIYRPRGSNVLKQLCHCNKTKLLNMFWGLRF